MKYKEKLVQLIVKVKLCMYDKDKDRPIQLMAKS